MKRKMLRSGYTTGACAAAAAKAATQVLVGALHATPLQVDIPFPDGSRATLGVHRSVYSEDDNIAFASVIKDAGDDPDVTNGAEIVVAARIARKFESANVRNQSTRDTGIISALPLPCSSELVIKGGRGVGIVTKPGLSIPPGEPAINPVPRRMILDAVSEAMSEVLATEDLQPSSVPRFRASDHFVVEVVISVTDGELLAKKTLNERLGIIGGISILGTTGIVRPLSSDAWTATIVSSMDVARAMGRDEIVLSAGRTSERAHMRRYNLPEESYVMMGDYLEFSLREAAGQGFSRIDLCAQWAKMLKIAMATPQTHVRHGAIDLEKTIGFLISLGLKFPKNIAFNTAREIFDYIQENSESPGEELIRVCYAAESYARGIADPGYLTALLVSYDGEIIAQSA